MLEPLIANRILTTRHHVEDLATRAKPNRAGPMDALQLDGLGSRASPVLWVTDEAEPANELTYLVESVASYSLSTLGLDTTALRVVLLRLALSFNTPATASLLQSLLAVASVHRNGNQSQADKYKMAAIRAMRTSVNETQGSDELLQHIAAGMLLCSFEVRGSGWTGTKPLRDS